MSLTLVEELRTRAKIRRGIPNRKSVQDNEPDRIADQLEQAADVIEKYYNALISIQSLTSTMGDDDGFPSVYAFIERILNE